jgi:hypothetical protein
MTIFHGEFITIECADSLELDAIWCPPAPGLGGRQALVHIHGKAGNFYHNEFLRQMYAALPAHGIAVLGLNTRGAGTLVEGFRGHQVDYVGAATETLAESLLDVDAAVRFVESRGLQPVLQGHSHGCEKLLWWGTQRPATPTVMLSPADSAALQRTFCGKEELGRGVEVVRRDPPAPWDFLAEGTYGVDINGTRYLLPVTHRSFSDAVLGPSIYLFDSTAPSESLRAHKGDVLVLLGGDDPLQLPSAAEFGTFLKHERPDWDIRLLEHCDHHFSANEPSVIQLVVDFCEAAR